MSTAPMLARSTEHPFPAALEDALAAYAWLIEQPGAQVVLAGDSAGAGLACSLLLPWRAQGLPLPAGAILMCPAVDLTGQSVLTATGSPDAESSTRRSAES